MNETIGDLMLSFEFCAYLTTSTNMNTVALLTVPEAECFRLHRPPFPFF